MHRMQAYTAQLVGWKLCLFKCPGYGFEPPRRTTARLVRPVVEGGSDPAHGRALAAQPPDLGERGLLGGLRFQVLAVAGQPGAKCDIADAPALAPFVPERVARPLPDRFAFPLADGTHDRNHQASRR